MGIELTSDIDKSVSAGISRLIIITQIAKQFNLHYTVLVIICVYYLAQNIQNISILGSNRSLKLTKIRFIYLDIKRGINI